MALSIATYILIGIITWLLCEWYNFNSVKSKLTAIPTVGSDSFLLSYISAWKFLWYGREMLQEGYNKYPNGAFKMPTLETGSRWLVIVNSQKSIEELKNAPDEVLSTQEFILDILQGRHTWGGAAEVEPYHVEVIHGGLTRGLSARFADIVDEIDSSFREHIPPSEDWTSHTVLGTIVSIVCRTSNRLFLGLPLCRNKEYLEVLETFAVQLMIAAAVVNLCPWPFKGVVGPLITYFPKTLRKLEKFLGEMLEDRLRMEEEHGKKWEGRPNDLVSWLLDQAPLKYRNVHDLTLRTMIVNFAATHTTSVVLSSTLLQLASCQEYIDPLRREIEEVIDSHGWSKESMGRLRKLDSFVKECSRISGIGSVSVSRKAMKDFTFSDGTFIPAGISISAPLAPIHNDPFFYDGDTDFNGFRFSDKREEESSTDPLNHVKHQMYTPTSEYLTFGLGKHACPGRFFAVNEIKSIVAHILINYDIKAPEKPNDPPRWFGTQFVPNSTAQLLFRRRQT